MIHDKHKNSMLSRWTPLSSRKQYFLAYTGFFLFACLGVFIWYLAAGRTFIWQIDGWTQHYKSLVYFGRYLRSIVKNLLFNGQLVIPTWDFTIGEGSDILSALHYYVIGDPLNLLSAAVPTRYMWVLYDFLILLRLYLAGLFFSQLCFQTGQKNRYGVLAGALAYAFCSWALLNSARHPYFLNPMVYLPLLIMGVEKVIHGKRPWLLVAAVFISAVSNLYFFYMLVLMVVIYTIVRLILLYRKRLLEALRLLLRIGLFALLGVLLGSAILLPMMTAFLGSSRMAVENGALLVYPISYYSQLLSLLVSTSSSYWLYMGCSVTVVPAIFLLFRKRKKYGFLKALFLICIVIILLPTLGQMTNGFSYIANRWCWAFTLLCAYILTAMWPSLMSLTIKEVRFLVCCTAGYLAACLLLEYSRTATSFLSMAIVFLFLFLLAPVGERGQTLFFTRWRQMAALALSVASIFIHSYYMNAYSAGNYAAESKTVDEVSKLTENETAAVYSMAKSDGIDTFYRYSGRSVTTNANMIAGISSTAYYWSIGNPYVSEFRSVLGQREYLPYFYFGYDDRTALLSLASVRYYVLSATDMNPLPYGFTYLTTISVTEADTSSALETLKEELGTDELTEDQVAIIIDATATRYAVYRNDYTLPLAYTFERSLSEDAWNGLNEMDKQESLLQTVVIADEAADGGTESLDLTSESLDYTVTGNSREITQQGDSFVVTAPNATVTLTFEGLENSENYFVINGLTYDGTSTHELYFGDESVDPSNLYNETRWNLLPKNSQHYITRDNIFWTEATSLDLTVKSSSGVSKTLSYHTPYYQFYNDRHDFAVNLGYTEEAATAITITFPSIGIYSFDSISVICQPMDNYVEQVTALGEDTPDNLEIGTNTVSGTISLDSDKWLCFSIPYSTGWRAYVDGEEAKLYQANVQYMAISLEAGDHTIKLVYENPQIKVGICVSAAALIVLAGTVVIYEQRKKHSKPKGTVQ